MKLIIALVIVFSSFVGYSQEDYTITASKILKMPKTENINTTFLDVAKQFLGKPYVAQTLEKSPENLVFNLRELDCFTLVENVVALSLSKHNPEVGLDVYKEYLQLLRYRAGVIDGYASRLHYFIEWANQAVENGFLINETETLGDKQEKPIDFMSTHRNLYPALAKDDLALAKVSEFEQALNQEAFYIVPKEKFKTIESDIKDGDIIAFTSTIKGLDVNHVGFAIWQSGKLHLLHASLDQKKVIISTETLGEYLAKIKKHSGIIILRAL